ncbi:MAG: c-type cytochrome [Filomicrobium sp.]
MKIALRDLWPRGFARLAMLILALIASTAAAHAADKTEEELEHARLVRHGAEIFQRCTACHRIGVDATNRIGPQLNNLIGRKAGSIDGARYSEAMKRAGEDGLVWTTTTLDAFLSDPPAFIEGTTMGLRGVADEGERKALIVYLEAFSLGAADIPEIAVTPPRRSDPKPADEIMAIKGDPEFGEYLSGECLTCHQPSGANKGIPSIIGWPTEDFVIAMHAYKTQSRKHPVMRMIAGRLSDEEIASLAAFFQTKTK